MLQGESGKQQLFLLYNDCTNVHGRPLEGKSQQLPLGIRELCPNNFEHNDGVKELRIILAF